MLLNSSGNFFIYCLVGHLFRRELCRTLGFRHYNAIPGGLLVSHTGVSTGFEVNRRSSKYDSGGGGGVGKGNGIVVTSTLEVKCNGGSGNKRRKSSSEGEENEDLRRLRGK
jgi:hypothetical protein